MTQSSMLAALRSARPALWIPILLNAGLSAFLLTSSLTKSLLAGVSLCCMAGFGFLINDLKDITVDRDNRAGKLDSVGVDALPFVKKFTLLLALLGITFAIPLGFRPVLATLCVGAGLVIYTYAARPRLLF